MQPKNAFAFSRSEFGNHMAAPLKVALIHHYCIAWSRQQGTVHYLQDHWRDEMDDYILVFLSALTDDTTLQPARRARECLDTVERIKTKDAKIRQTAKNHYGDVFPEQVDEIKYRELPDNAADSFWVMVHAKAKRALITEGLVGKRGVFEKTFGPIE